MLYNSYFLVGLPSLRIECKGCGQNPLPIHASISLNEKLFTTIFWLRVGRGTIFMTATTIFIQEREGVLYRNW